MHQPVGRALLITGPYGSGKSVVAAEIADVLERADARFALLDLDYLSWANPPDVDVHEDASLLLGNLAAVVRNYRRAGIDDFVVAGYVTADVADAIRATLEVPLVVVALDVPWDEIERRLTADATSGRGGDVAEARRQFTRPSGPVADVVVGNDRPVARTAHEILRLVGWLDREGGSSP
jgi:hypothetical protein